MMLLYYFYKYIIFANKILYSVDFKIFGKTT